MKMRQAGLKQFGKTGNPDVAVGGIRSLKNLVSMLIPFLPMLGFVFLMTLGMTGISILIPKIAGNLVDNTLNDLDGVQELNRVALYMFGLIAVMATLRYFSSYHLGRVGARFLLRLRRRVFDHVIYLSLSFFERRQTGEINARMMTNLEAIQGLLTEYALGGIQTILQLIGVTVILFFTNYELALIALAACVPIVVLTVLYGDKLEQSFLKEKDALANTSANVEEVLSGIGTVQAFGNEKQEVARYAKLMDDHLDSQLVVVKRESSYMAFMEFFGYTAVALVLWYGGQLILADKLSIGDLTACLIYMFMFGMGIQELGELFSNYRELKGVNHRIFEILDEKSTVEDKGTARIDLSETLNIDFSDVSFAYPADPDRTVLHDISLNVVEGEDLAIVGPTGSGKTTIFKLLLRFYDPATGNLSINGRPLPEYELNNLRKLFGLVSQDIFLFSGSVLENVCYGTNEVSIKDVENAIETIGATDFIASLKNGLHEEVGVGGSKLSGGQKQLLGIARIYLRNPRILLLDEATSALDSESEQKVQNSLSLLKKDRTTIVIAHRLATVSESNRIVLLKDGKLVAQGNHESLSETSELYRKYWQWQSRGQSRGKPLTTVTDMSPAVSELG